VRDPYPQFADLRERDPVHRFDVVSGWVITRFDDCAEILRDERFSAQIHDSTFEQGQRHEFATPEQNEAVREFFGRSLLFSHGPRHRSLRSAVRDHFSPAAMRRFAPVLREIVAGLVASLPVGESFDFVEAYSDVLPLRVISALIGIPVGDERELKTLVGGVGPLMDIVKSPQQRDAAAHSLVELRRFVRRLVDREQFAEDSLGASLVTRCQRGELPDSDVVGMLALLLVTGSETTCNLLTSAAYHLGRDSRQLAALQAGGDCGVAPFVEEVLRLYPPVVGVARVATEDVEFRGKTIRKGDYVIVALASANRDERAGQHGNAAHLSFGHGMHRCLGAQLGTMQAQTTVAAIVATAESFRAREPGELRATQVLRGWKHLYVSLSGSTKRNQTRRGNQP
jgi:cytochrome P450